MKTAVLVCVIAVLCIATSVYARGNPQASCNFQGVTFADSNYTSCECFDCYSGPTCAQVHPSCTVDSTGGDPRMYSDWWEQQDPNNWAAVDITSFYRIGYQLHSVMVQPAPIPVSGQQGILKTLRTAVLALHDQVGNVQTEGYTIVFGNGCTQLINAACYAFHKLENKQVTAFAQTPYFSHYQAWAEFIPSQSKWNSSLAMRDTSNIVEYVTVPNNPDGKPRQQHYKNAHGVYDMVYNWPSLTNNVTKRAAHEVMMFSMSKLSGHAGTRIGWALVRNPIVAAHMTSFIGMMNLQPSIEALYRTQRVLQYIVDSKGAFFSDIKTLLTARWNQLLPLMQKQTRFQQLSVPGGFYMWVKCTRDTNCYQVFLNHGIRGVPGTGFGADNTYVRLELVMRQKTFEIFLKHFAALMATST